MAQRNPQQSLPLRAVIPGLVIILLVDFLAILGFWPAAPGLNTAFSMVLLLLPWVTLLVSRGQIRSLGYRRERFLKTVGWGMVAGGLWRIFSLLFNLWGLSLGASLDPWMTRLIGAVIWVPLLEETFFRGYLGRSLISKLGLWPGTLLQALLFSLHPVHLGQGAISLVSVFGFGLLAGWLQFRFDNLWSAWAAHAFANVLPLLVFI